MGSLKIKALVVFFVVAALIVQGISISSANSSTLRPDDSAASSPAARTAPAAKGEETGLLPTGKGAQAAPPAAPGSTTERSATADLNSGGSWLGHGITALIAAAVSAVVSFLFNLFGWGRAKGPVVQAGPTAGPSAPPVEQPDSAGNYGFESTDQLKDPVDPTNPFVSVPTPADNVSLKTGGSDEQARMAKIAQRALTPTPVRPSNPSYMPPQSHNQQPPVQANEWAEAERQRAEQAAFQAQQQAAAEARNRQAAAVSQFQSDFCAMVDRGGLSRKTFEDFLLAHGTVRWVSGIDGSHVALSNEPVDNELLLVLQPHSGGNAVLLPSYSFISDFPGLYTKARDVPRDVLSAFELGDGGHHTLRIARLGTVSAQGDGYVLDEPRGQLSGISN